MIICIRSLFLLSFLCFFLSVTRYVCVCLSLPRSCSLSLLLYKNIYLLTPWPPTEQTTAPDDDDDDS